MGDKIIFRKQSFQLENILGSVTSLKTSSGGTYSERNVSLVKGSFFYEMKIISEFLALRWQNFI